jgi:hypothetical protein
MARRGREGRLEDHAGSVTGLQTDMHDLREEMNRRFEAVDQKIDRLDDKVSRHFTWLVGIQVATLVAIVGALLGR